MAEDKESRTEQPTAKKLSKSRQKGQVAKSQEVNTFFVLLMSMLFFTYFAMMFIGDILALWREYFSSAAEYELTQTSLIYLLRGLLDQLATIGMPFMLTIAATGIVINYWQNDGWLLSTEPMKPKFNKVNPLKGWKKFLGKEGAMNLVKSVGKLIIVATAVWIAMKDELEKIPILMELPLEKTLQMLGSEASSLLIRVLTALAIIAIIDFTYQKWRYKDNLKMTKQEVKDERKQQEGDPIIKNRIRQKQYEMHRARMMEAIPEAEVIITNPTHLSIALRYNRIMDHAPVVVAKGSGYIALKIREVAKENGITIVEDKPLAQTLFKNVDIGETVPESLYKAVAETLAYVYKLKNKQLI